MTAPQFAARVLAAWLAAVAAGVLLAQEQPPPADEVFLYTVRADAERVYFAFDVREGHYLYRSRFGFDSATNGVAIGAARFPRGEIHSDQYFGEQQIFRGEFEVAVPYRRSAPVENLDLKLELQGCKDEGLCYLPQEWDAAVKLPAPTVFDLTPAAAGSDQLPVDEAFTMNARFDKPNELTVAWQIAPGYYLYRDKLTFAVDGTLGLGAAKLPEGVAHTDDSFGDVEIFRDYVEVKVPFSRASPDAIDVLLTAGFQGCKEASICYPPGEQTMALALPASSEFATATSGADAGGELISEQDQWAARIVNGSWPELLGWFFLGGLLLSFTPCVLPMVPILSSIIAGQGTVSTGRGFALSVSYVLGMAFTYTILGMLSALAGQQLQAALQEPWLLSAFAAVFVLGALGLFGAFQFQMPAAIQTRLSNLANRQKAGTFVGTAVIGALTAAIVTTCVAPVLVGALVVIGQTGDVARGGGALFAMSIGMGTPLLAVGASAGYLLPKVGPWMNTIKAGFGIIMLGFAIYMVGRFLPPTPTLFLWALLVFFTGVFIGGFDPLPANPTLARRFAKGVGALVCLYGALMFVGALLGGGSVLQPIPRAALTSGSGGGALATVDDEEKLPFRSIETIAELDAALGEAKTAGQPVMLDFTAEWCVSCKEMEEYTFPDAGVIGALKPFMLLRADVTDNNDDDQALLQRVRSFGPPTIAFFDSGGTERDNFKLVGFVPAAEFTGHVQRLAAL
jgi:thiol:disulfide interchange protein DsbD